jgi:hypothetical protein
MIKCHRPSCMWQTRNSKIEKRLNVALYHNKCIQGRTTLVSSLKDNNALQWVRSLVIVSQGRLQFLYLQYLVHESVPDHNQEVHTVQRLRVYDVSVSHNVRVFSDLQTDVRGVHRQIQANEDGRSRTVLSTFRWYSYRRTLSHLLKFEYLAALN